VNNSHHRWRVHPDPGLDYTWLYLTTLINRVERQATWFDAPSGTGTGIQRAGWIDNCHMVLGNTASIIGGIDGPSQEYAYVTNNLIESDTILSAADISMSGTVLTTKTPNTFTGSLPGSDPAWGGAGDPSGISWDF